nr:MFS transporter [Candidatus Sigynarchaeota archaeon]
MGAVEEKTDISGDPSGEKAFVKSTWPILLGSSPQTLTWWGSWYVINILVVSNLFWPGDPLHGQALGLYYGLGLIVQSFTILVLGYLSDKYSRLKLMTVNTVIDGILFMVYGFVPVGMGDASFLLFLFICVVRAVITAGGGTSQNSPLLMSYVDDAIKENQRSRFFGVLILIQQLSNITGGIIAAIIFKQYWREYFWISGLILAITGVIIGLKVKEPKRGAERNELRNILKLASVNYRYRLSRETAVTLRSRSNIAIMLEGIFTQIIQAVPFLLLFAYLQSPPYNMSPLSLSFVAILFGLPGAMIGGVVLAKLSDSYAKKSIKNRVRIIFTSLVMSYVLWLLVFVIPIAPLTPAEGDNFLIVMSRGAGYWGISICYLLGQANGNLFAVNQRPILQKINLPEAQGLISSANVFLETIGRGMGMILAGSFLDLFSGNYPMTVLVFIALGSVGSVLWLLTLRWIDRDVTSLSEILTSRAGAMVNQEKK